MVVISTSPGPRLGANQAKIHVSIHHRRGTTDFQSVETNTPQYDGLLVRRRPRAAVRRTSSPSKRTRRSMTD